MALKTLADQKHENDARKARALDWLEKHAHFHSASRGRGYWEMAFFYAGKMRTTLLEAIEASSSEGEETK